MAEAPIAKHSRGTTADTSSSRRASQSWSNVFNRLSCRRGRRTASNSTSMGTNSGSSSDVPDGPSLVQGTLMFPHGSRRRPSRWVRIPEQAEPSELMKVLTQLWGLKAPDAVISVVGSNFDALNEQQTCVRGLSSAGTEPPPTSGPRSGGAVAGAAAFCAARWAHTCCLTAQP